jgi:uncharacterized membrane protein
MSSTTTSAPITSVGAAKIRTITLDHPWRWLAAGWHDLRRAPTASLAFGSCFVVLSYLLTLGLVYGEMFYYIPPLAAGYLLVAPLLGIGLYDISRQLEQGSEVSLGRCCRAWRGNHVQIAAMGIILMMVMLVWILIANLVFTVFFDKPIPNWENFIPVVFLSGKSPMFLLMGMLSGAAIAFFVFAISAISVPMLLDRPTDVMSAIITSIAAVRQNWRPMALWAALIALLVGVGLITFYLALAVTMPLVGHATWHAYRDLVEPEV